jgi:ribosome maturation factor RimP
MDVRHEVLEIATPLAEELGFELVDVEVVPQGRLTLRVSIDRVGGVTIEDCSRVSRRLGDALEMNQTVPHRFVLEVSSPGVERRLRTPEHFRRYIGSRVFVQVHDLIDGRRKVEGELVEADDTSATVRLEEGGLWTAPLAAVQKAHLVVDPWAELKAARAKEKKSDVDRARARRSDAKETR